MPNKSKNVRIANLLPCFLNELIYFNRSDVNTIPLESKLVTFDESVDSKENDIMDTLAYVLKWIYYIPSALDMVEIDGDNQWILDSY